MELPEIRDQRDMFTMVRLSPHPSLRPFVDSYWFVEGNSGKDNGQGHALVYPLGYPMLEFNLADKWIKRRDDHDDAGAINSNITGVMNNRLWIRPIGRIRTAAARLHPSAIGLLIPGSERKDVVLDPELLFGRRFAEAEEKIAVAKTKQEMKNHLDSFFTHVFSSDRLCVDYRVRYLLGEIIKRRGRLSLRERTKELCVSQKRIEQLFREHIGMSPNAYAGIARFQNVFEIYRPGMSLTELALATGYYDQSHFIRHFKRYTGCTPKQFFSEEFVEAYKVSNLYNFSR